jgi:hypothetical protein
VSPKYQASLEQLYGDLQQASGDASSHASSVVNLNLKFASLQTSSAIAVKAPLLVESSESSRVLPVYLFIFGSAECALAMNARLAESSFLVAEPVKHELVSEEKGHSSAVDVCVHPDILKMAQSDTNLRVSLINHALSAAEVFLVSSSVSPECESSAIVASSLLSPAPDHPD